MATKQQKERLEKLAGEADPADEVHFEAEDAPEPTEAPLTLAEAMVKIQAELPVIGKNKTGRTGNQTYTYTPIEVIHPVVLPIVTKYGCSISYDHSISEGCLWSHATIEHGESGQAKTTAYPIQLPGDFRNIAKEFGSLGTYGNRYALKSLLALSLADEDDDGSSTDGLTKPQEQPQGGQDPRRTPPAKSPQAPAQPRQDDNEGQRVVTGRIDRVKRGLWKGVNRNGPTELCAVEAILENGNKLEMSNFVPQAEAVIGAAEAALHTGVWVRILYSPNPKKAGKWTIDGVMPAEEDSDDPPHPADEDEIPF